jgi:hypothetical protein
MYQPVIDNITRTYSSNFRRFIIPITERAMPQLLLNNFFGIQPIRRPDHYIEFERAVKNKSPVFTSPYDIAKFYSGYDSKNVNFPSPTVISKEKKKVNIQEVPILCPIDINLVDNVTSDIVKDITDKFVVESDKLLIKTLHEISGPPVSSYVFDKYYHSNQTTYTGDHNSLAIMINTAGNIIAARTRLGAGNRVIVSKFALAILSSATTAAFSKVKNERYIGILNNSALVYLDPDAADDAPVIVSYKGSETKAPVIFSPYLPLNFLAISNDNIFFSSINGYYEIESDDRFFGKSQDYVVSISIDPSGYSFI